nr:HD domain-containing protein [Phascolarctobacterium succinatutens]
MAENIELTAQELAENELLNDAIAYAATMHRNGLRKGTTMPYIVHPLEVMHILEVMTGDKHLMAAGVLHDVVEDTSATLEDVYAKFGDDIGTLVEGHTEKHKEDPWEKRKEEALAHLAKADAREQKLVLADKLANMRAIARDYAKYGEDLWQRFKRGKDIQSWYYHAAVKAMSDLEFDTEAAPFYKEFEDKVNQVFGYEENAADAYYELAKKYEMNDEPEKAVAYFKKAVDVGNLEAMISLGFYYSDGVVVEQDEEKALKLFLQPALEGYKFAMLRAGSAYYYGSGTEPNYFKALLFLMPLTEDEDDDFPEACYIVGRCYQFGKGIDEDQEKAFDYLAMAADAGFAPAQTALADAYLEGDLGLETDYKQAHDYYLKAAEQDFMPAFNGLGITYLHGLGCRENVAIGMQWLAKGAHAGDANAQKNLGDIYFEGDLVDEDFAEALHWYEEAAEQGYAAAKTSLGVMYENGYGVDVDLQKAFDYYTDAADEDEAGGLFNMGRCYFNGTVVEQDMDEAVEYFHKAAEAGSVDAMCVLGDIYDEGNEEMDIEPDLKKSFYWYNEAAKNGHAEAQFNVAKCYENGKGTRKNRPKAFEWYQRAAEQGHSGAMNDIGIYYAQGVVVEQDYDEAFKWFKRAAEDETYAGGLYNLARCYREGLGTKKNEVEADRLTALADELEQDDCLVSEVEDTEE